ncbi:MAG: lactate utilization protein C [Betaproteobacteria bacterium]|nr:lactate utilization protein C [Betaproteobacteria bacterium]
MAVTLRDNILSRIRAAQGRTGAPTAQERAAVEAHIKAHPSGPRPQSDWEPVARFCECAVTLATTVDRVGTLDHVPLAVARYLHEYSLPRSAACWPEFIGLEWHAAGINVEARAAQGSDLVGITGCFCAIAETGTLMLLSGPSTPAATSLLPETHVAVVRTSRIVRGMEDAWNLLRGEHTAMPRAVNFVSGPSRTADIEQTLVLGAHGPYRVHIVLLGATAAAKVDY